MQLTEADRPTLIAHSLVASLATRFATQHSDMLNRLVVYAGLAIEAYRLPAGLQLAAIRFVWYRPAQRRAFDRWALHDLDGFRRRHRIGMRRSVTTAGTAPRCPTYGRP